MHPSQHRTHLDIFDGRFFPQVSQSKHKPNRHSSLDSWAKFLSAAMLQPFKNWWSDDWISAVYGRYGTFRAHGVQVLHNVHAQKQGEEG